MLVLIVGDLHLPLRASSLPLKFRKLLVPGKIQQIICTGNVCDRETWEYLRTIAPDVKGVKGDFDESPHLPPTLTLNHPPIRIGVIHGHQILPLGDPDLLNSLATTMDVDVLVSGATHKFEAYESDGRFFVNPGSATGAWASLWPVYPEKHQGTEEEPAEKPEAEEKQSEDKSEKPETAPQEKSAPPAPPAQPPIQHPDPTPSFVLLDIQGSTVMCYVYQLIAGDVKVEKIEYKKGLGSATGSNGAHSNSVAANTPAAGIASGDWQ